MNGQLESARVVGVGVAEQEWVRNSAGEVLRADIGGSAEVVVNESDE